MEESGPSTPLAVSEQGVTVDWLLVKQFGLGGGCGGCGFAAGDTDYAENG
jgi:hypothetical protein